MRLVVQGVVEGVGEALREDVVEVGVDIELNGEHVSRGEAGALCEGTPDTLVAVGCGPIERDGEVVVVGGGAGVCGCDDASGRVEDLRELIEGNVAGPLVRGGGDERNGAERAAE